ncbi:hypothetical protein NLU13_3963 [Sarocladium strictum]|uniref:ER membrane protein complex subunit 1 n=1 Tax=Sarocladium strictum TaxID=5046 RepID=A0AA39GJD2_SARSR|nr:hypothetical protein NLU13_3963 [Sarocladium strictum]
MRRSLQSLLLLGLSSIAAAVFKDEVGHIDFHHKLIGVPQSSTTFFHRPRKEDKASLLYTLSDVGVVGAVNPSNGEVVWRQQVTDEITNGGGHLRAPEGENWVASAYGSKVQTWNALSGRNIWQMEFDGSVKDLEILELADTPRKDVLALFDENGTTVLRRLHGGLGTVIWEFREISKDIPLQVSTDITNIYVIALHGTTNSYNLRITSLDIVNGGRVDAWSLGSKGDVQKAEDVMFVGANSAAPLIAWTQADSKKLTVNVLGSKSKQDLNLPADTFWVQVHAPHLAQSQPHFLVHMRTNSGNKAEVYHINLKSHQISKAYELPKRPGYDAFATSSDGANVYFTRITEDEVTIVSSDSHGILARWPYETPQGDSEIVHAASEVVKKAGGEGFAVRAAATTFGDDWKMIRNGQVDWTRPEGLTGAVAAIYADIPVAENLAKVLEQEAHSNPFEAYVHRLTRHVNELMGLPDYLASLPSRFMKGLAGDDEVTQEQALSHDSFGFNKIAIIATRRGRFYGLTTGNGGAVIWSKKMFSPKPGKSVEIKGLLAEDDKPTAVAIGSQGELVVFEVLTGHALHNRPSTETPIASTAVAQGKEGRWLLPFGVDGKVVGALPVEIAPLSTIVVRQGDILKGIKLVDQAGQVVPTDIWQFQVLSGQEIVDIALPAAHDPVASIGRVLGDRRVSYKYLNANNLVVAVYDKGSSVLSIRLIDSVSGQLLASQSYPGVDSDKPISCTTAENWYACTFFGQYTLDDGTNRSIKGYQVVSSDLYESPEPNDRGPLGDAETFSPLNPVDTPTGPPLPWVVSQSFVVSQPLTALSVTQTRQGIANRNLLAYLPESHGIVGIARQAIDPRRPVGRDPTAAEMEAEGLPKYSPALEIDPRSILSHEFDVIGVEHVITTPAFVESTSLILAFGLDIFGTRVTPSGTFDILGKGFNKTTLILTVVGLFVGVLFLGPTVRQKQINKRWEAPL